MQRKRGEAGEEKKNTPNGFSGLVNHSSRGVAVYNDKQACSPPTFLSVSPSPFTGHCTARDSKKIDSFKVCGDSIFSCRLSAVHAMEHCVKVKRPTGETKCLCNTYCLRDLAGRYTTLHFTYLCGT